MSGNLAAIDWGTSNARAYLIGADGAVIERKNAPWGIAGLDRGEIPDRFDKLVGPWLRQHPGIAVLMAGMIGSSIGWAETAYVPCPASLDELAGSLLQVTETPHHTFMVPGISVDGGNAGCDVIRGEETQIVGAADADQFLVLPGTHPKWVTVEGGSITSFTTAMTGEVFALLCDHSVLAHSMDRDTEFDTEAFDEGIALARQRNLLGNLFQVRARALLKDESNGFLTGLASGLLIGEEIAAMADGFMPGGVNPLLVGDPALCERYTRAFRHFDIESTAVDGETAFVNGVRRLAQRANL